MTPIRRLGLATRRVRSTRDLTARVEVNGRDEVAALAADFNGMLEALDASNRSSVSSSPTRRTSYGRR